MLRQGKCRRSSGDLLPFFFSAAQSSWSFLLWFHGLQAEARLGHVHDRPHLPRPLDEPIAELYMAYLVHKMPPHRGVLLRERVHPQSIEDLAGHT